MALVQRRQHNKKHKRKAPKASNKTVTDYEYRLPRVNYHVPRKPPDILAVSRFTMLKTNSDLTKCLVLIIQELRKHDRESHFFRKVDLDGYDEIISNAIHFGEILENIERGGKYLTFGEIKRDTDLLWANCYKFNGQPDREKPEQRGFSNFASEVQWVYDRYVDDFIDQLVRKGWIKNQRKRQSSELLDYKENQDFLVAVKNEFEPKPKKRRIDNVGKHSSLKNRSE